VPRADDEPMDGTLPRAGAGPRRGQVGAALSLFALGLAVASLFGPHGRACPTPGSSASLDLTPLLLFAVATLAVIVDVGAVRRGDVLWGRIGLTVVSAAAVVGIWAGASGFFGPGCS
jgi:hypothetical protein